MIRSKSGRSSNARAAQQADAVCAALDGRSVVMIGMMGCGKSAVGRRVAQRLGLPFADADEEIEVAAGMSITDIFEEHGEPYFREGERKVIERLLSDGQKVLATGGGAIMNDSTRAAIRDAGVSVWLRADLSVLLRRVGWRDKRPLLRDGDPEATMRRLLEIREPIYAEADLTITSREGPHDTVVGDVIEGLHKLLAPPAQVADRGKTG